LNGYYDDDDEDDDHRLSGSTTTVPHLCQLPATEAFELQSLKPRFTLGFKPTLAKSALVSAADISSSIDLTVR
jgi:hypothetical protein